MQPRTHFLHIFPTFSTGGAQIRTIDIINYLGPRVRHTIMALDRDFSASVRIDPGIDFDCYECPRTANPVAMALRLRAAMKRLRPDLVLTYAWGAIDGVTAALMPPRLPVIHTEDGFGIEESERQKVRRVLFRRYILRGASFVIAPSKTLESIMLRVWRLRPESVVHIPNGVDVRRFAPAATRSESNTVRIGAAAQLRPEKRLDLLLETFASVAAGRNLTLHIAGEGPECEKLGRQTADLGIREKVRFLGRVHRIAEFYRSLDILALTSSTEQMPLCVLEAMACGLPVVSTDVGDVAGMVSEANRPYVVRDADLAGAVASLVNQPELRARIGQANREKCCAEYGIGEMSEAWEQIYMSAMTRGDAKPAESPMTRVGDREVVRR